MLAFSFQNPYNVSIHSLRKKGDSAWSVLILERHTFQSTPFARRETGITGSSGWCRWCFNPLPSQEGRLCDMREWDSSKSFQSTPFARREITKSLKASKGYYVSIHSLRKKGDFSTTSYFSPQSSFNPLPSQEGRQQSCTNQTDHIC